MKQGIKLNFGDDGISVASPEERLETCFAQVECEFCRVSQGDSGQIMECTANRQGVANLASLEKCPKKKWVTLKYHGSGAILSSTRMGCNICGSLEQWRVVLDPHNGKLVKDGKWLCRNCHPPAMTSKHYQVRHEQKRDGHECRRGEGDQQTAEDAL